MDWMLAKLKSNNTRILSFLMSEGLKFRLSGAFVSKTNIDCGAVWFKTFKRCKQTLQRGELSPTRWQQKQDLQPVCCCSSKVNSHWITCGRKLLLQSYLVLHFWSTSVTDITGGLTSDGNTCSDTTDSAVVTGLLWDVIQCGFSI